MIVIRHDRIAYFLFIASLIGCTGEVDPSGASAGADGGKAVEGGVEEGGFVNWVSYGRDRGTSRHNYQETKISPDNVAAMERKWQIDGAPVSSTPTIYDGIVYYGDWAGGILARDASTGEELWKADVREQVNNTPYVTDDRVYIVTAGTKVHALDRSSGQLLWDDPPTLDTTTAAAVWSSPQVVDGILVVGVGSFQVFLQESGTARGSVAGVDAETGELLWQTYMTKADETEGAGVSVWSSPAVDEERGVFYIGTGQAYEHPAPILSDALIAVDYRTGIIQWSEQFTENDVYTSFRRDGPDYDVGATPNLFTLGDRDVVGVGDKGGKYYTCSTERPGRASGKGS